MDEEHIQRLELRKHRILTSWICDAAFGTDGYAWDEHVLRRIDWDLDQEDRQALGWRMNIYNFYQTIDGLALG